MMQTPVRVITVEREYGSRGGEFAHDLAASLGWRLLDSELVAGAARAAGVAPELAAKYDERLDPWYYRYGKVFWQDSGLPLAGLSDEHVFDSERMLSLIRQQILDEAKQGNCVLVGRGAACALAASRDPSTFLSTPRRKPSATGSPRPSPSRPSTPINCRRPSTSAEQPSSASSTSRSGARGGFITCCSIRLSGWKA